MREAGDKPMWAPLLSKVLLTAMPHHHPVFAILGMAGMPVDEMGDLPEIGLPAIVKRWVGALRALGQVEVMGDGDDGLAD